MMHFRPCTVLVLHLFIELPWWKTTWGLESRVRVPTRAVFLFLGVSELYILCLHVVGSHKVECAALGRVFSSEETLSGLSTPPRSARFSRRPSSAPLHSVQQVHAEVWVATTEESTSFIEIIDILSRVRPNTHISTITMLYYDTVCITVVL